MKLNEGNYRSQYSLFNIHCNYGTDNHSIIYLDNQGLTFGEKYDISTNFRELALLTESLSYAIIVEPQINGEGNAT